MTEEIERLNLERDSHSALIRELDAVLYENQRQIAKNKAVLVKLPVEQKVLKEGVRAVMKMLSKSKLQLANLEDQISRLTDEAIAKRKKEKRK